MHFKCHHNDSYCIFVNDIMKKINNEIIKNSTTWWCDLLFWFDFLMNCCSNHWKVTCNFMIYIFELCCRNPQAWQLDIFWNFSKNGVLVSERGHVEELHKNIDLSLWGNVYCNIFLFLAHCTTVKSESWIELNHTSK